MNRVREGDPVVRIIVILMVLALACVCCAFLVNFRAFFQERFPVRHTPTSDPGGVWLSAPLTRVGDKLYYCCQNLSWQQNVGPSNLVTYLNGEYVPLEWGGFNEGQSWWRVPLGVQQTYPGWDTGSWSVTFWWDEDFGPRPNGVVVDNPNP